MALSAQPSGTIPSHMIDDLALRGWSVTPDYLPPDAVARLASEARRLEQGAALRPAGIGKGTQRSVNTNIRGDAILWLEETSLTDAQRDYLQTLEALRQATNAALQLGLFDFEGHLAIYPPGAFYQRHLDRFQTDSLRTLTAILYLNTDWREEDGGQLRMYLEDGQQLDVLPQGGTLVTFLAERFWHEVLPATRERLSITGWFKTRGAALP